MKPFATLTAPAMVIDLLNVNTDQIFPARFIKKPRSFGYAGYLFYDLRFCEEGTENPNFILNQTAYREAKILVGNTNFGCGSSREGAVYALQDYGFGVAIAPSFGDIFAANCVKNGFLPIVLEDALVVQIRQEIMESADPSMTVDLSSQLITVPGGRQQPFNIEPFHKHCILNGLNEIDLTLQREDEIASFELKYREEFRWLF